MSKISRAWSTQKNLEIVWGWECLHTDLRKPTPRATTVAVTSDLVLTFTAMSSASKSGYRGGEDLQRLLGQPPPPGWATSQTMRAFPEESPLLPVGQLIIPPNLLPFSS